MSNGYQTDTDAFGTLGGMLNQLADDLRDSGKLVESMVADPGLFGILGGQIIGAAASAYCDSTGDSLTEYASVVEKHREKLDAARLAYETRENEAAQMMSENQL